LRLRLLPRSDRDAAIASRRHQEEGQPGEPWPGPDLAHRAGGNETPEKAHIKQVHERGTGATSGRREFLVAVHRATAPGGTPGQESHWAVATPGHGRDHAARKSACALDAPRLEISG